MRLDALFSRGKSIPDAPILAVISNFCMLSGGGCAVYSARPTQCRAYPFWPRILISESKWAKEASVCEGIGRLAPSGPVSLSVITDQAERWAAWVRRFPDSSAEEVPSLACPLLNF